MNHERIGVASLQHEVEILGLPGPDHSGSHNRHRNPPLRCAPTARGAVDDAVDSVEPLLRVTAVHVFASVTESERSRRTPRHPNLGLAHPHSLTRQVESQRRREKWKRRRFQRLPSMELAGLEPATSWVRWKRSVSRQSPPVDTSRNEATFGASWDGLSIGGEGWPLCTGFAGSSPTSAARNA